MPLIDGEFIITREDWEGLDTTPTPPITPPELPPLLPVRVGQSDRPEQTSDVAVISYTSGTIELFPRRLPALHVKLLNENARLPVRGSPDAAGLDIHSSGTYVIMPGERVCVSTGVSIAVPSDFYARVAPRSGLAANFGIDVLAGVIDSDYRGEVKVILINHGDNNFNIGIGDRIAQLIITPYYAMEPTAVGSLPDTSRGSGGFGSTGGFTNTDVSVSGNAITIGGLYS